MHFSHALVGLFMLASTMGPGHPPKPPGLAAPGADAASSLVEVLSDLQGTVVRMDALVLGSGFAHLGESRFSGTAERFNADGQCVERVEYRSGLKHGTRQNWFDGGLLSCQSEYRDGRLEGAVHTWWSNGRMRSEAHFERGIPHGDQRQWYTDGALFKHRRLVQGREHGMQQAWRRNGKLYINYEVRDGRRYGLKRSSLCFQLDDEQVQ